MSDAWDEYDPSEADYADIKRDYERTGPPMPTPVPRERDALTARVSELEAALKHPLDYESGFADGLRAQLKNKETELNLRAARLAQLEADLVKPAPEGEHAVQLRCIAGAIEEEAPVGWAPAVMKLRAAAESHSTLIARVAELERETKLRKHGFDVETAQHNRTIAERDALRARVAELEAELHSTKDLHASADDRIEDLRAQLEALPALVGALEKMMEATGKIQPYEEGKMSPEVSGAIFVARDLARAALALASKVRS